MKQIRSLSEFSCLSEYTRLYHSAVIFSHFYSSGKTPKSTDFLNIIYKGYDNTSLSPFNNLGCNKSGGLVINLPSGYKFISLQILGL